MIIFIDESGDAGFKITKGSSKTFVIALVIFDDELEAEETALKIKKLRRELKRRDKFEFKFNKCDKNFRTIFLESIKSCKFRIRAIVIDKEKVYSQHLRSEKESFYNFALRQVLEHNNNTIKHAKIRLDGRGEKVFQKNLILYLRKHLNSETKKVMTNLRFRDSKKDVLIQLADMVAGSLRRFYDKQTTDSAIYWSIIKNRKEDLWLFR